MIKGSLSLLADPQLSLHKKEKLLTSCNYNCNRLTRLIENILDLKQLDDGKMVFKYKRLNLKTLIKKSIKLNLFFSENVNTQLVTEHLEDVYILGDADRLIQVLNNLIQNAIKFSLPSSVVTIKMTQNNKEVLVEVIDQGCGLGEESKEIIFKSFARK